MTLNLNNKTKNLTIAALMVAIGLILPYFTAHMFGVPGTVLLPMHIPILLCGLVCGVRYGMICAVIVPVLSSLLTGMPVFYPMLPIMVCELLVYGCVSGLMYKKFKFNVFLSLITAMVLGRVAYGLVFSILATINTSPLKALSVWGAITTGLPGIIIQLVLIPTVVIFLDKHVFKNTNNEILISKAKQMIKNKEVNFVVINQNKIVYTANQRGISVLIDLFENQPEKLKGAIIVDKVIGKAAAMIFVYAGVNMVYGETMSNHAKKYLNSNQIKADYGICVDSIINREGNGICPMESSVLDIEDAKVGYDILVKKVAELKKKI